MDVPSNFNWSSRCCSIPALAICLEVRRLVNRIISFVRYCGTHYFETSCISVLRNIWSQLLDIAKFLWRLWIFIKLCSDIFLHKMVNWSFQLSGEIFSPIDFWILCVPSLFRSLMGFW